MLLFNACITSADRRVLRSKFRSDKYILRLREGRVSSLPCLPLLEQPLFQDVGLFVTSADPEEAGVEILLRWWDIPLCHTLHTLWYYLFDLLPGASIATRLQAQRDIYQEIRERRPAAEKWAKMKKRQRRTQDGAFMATSSMFYKFDSVMVPIVWDAKSSAAKAFRERAGMDKLDVPEGCHASVPVMIDVCGTDQEAPAIQLGKHVNASPEWNARLVPIGKREWVNSPVPMHANFNSSQWQPVHAVEDVCRRNDAVIKGSKVAKDLLSHPFSSPSRPASASIPRRSDVLVTTQSSSCQSRPGEPC